MNVQHPTPKTQNTWLMRQYLMTPWTFAERTDERKLSVVRKNKPSNYKVGLTFVYYKVSEYRHYVCGVKVICVTDTVTITLMMTADLWRIVWVMDGYALY